MELYGELLLWLVDPGIYPSNIGRVFFPMRSILYDLFSVLLPVRCHTSASSIFPVVPRLDARFPLALALYTSSAMCAPARWSIWSMVELIGENSHYDHVRYPNGRETTASTRHLADCLPPSVPIQPGSSLEGEPDPHSMSTSDSSEVEGIPAPPSTPDPDVSLRWSERTRNLVDRLVLHFLRKW